MKQFIEWVGIGCCIGAAVAFGKITNTIITAAVGDAIVNPWYEKTVEKLKKNREEKEKYVTVETETAEEETAE